MNKALWKKCISESALLYAALALGIAAFAWFRVHVVGEVDTTSFQKILALLPEEWLKFTSVDVDWLISYVGRTAMTLDEPFLIMMVAIWGIVRGSDVISGEISRGTMEMLLAQPVSRMRVYLIHTAVTLLGVGLLVAVTWLFMWISVHTTLVKVPSEPDRSFWGQVESWLQTPSLKVSRVESVKKPMAEFVDSTVFAPGIINLLLLGWFVAGLATLLSSIDRYRWRTLGIASAVYMAAAMIKILAMSSGSFSWVSWLTFFSLYEPELSIKLFQNDPAAFWQMWRVADDGSFSGFGPMFQNLVLLISSIGFFAIALRIFQTRDIPAPL
jgi:ABC-2 type transport system permease protein